MPKAGVYVARKRRRALRATTRWNCGKSGTLVHDMPVGCCLRGRAKARSAFYLKRAPWTVCKTTPHSHARCWCQSISFKESTARFFLPNRSSMYGSTRCSKIAQYSPSRCRVLKEQPNPPTCNAFQKDDHSFERLLGPDWTEGRAFQCGGGPASTQRGLSSPISAYGL
jgi:hypothetical protein